MKQTTFTVIGIVATTILLLSCFQEKTVVEIPIIDQDINANESAVADQAIEILLDIDSIHMVMGRRNGLYEVHSKTGKVFFKRLQSEQGYTYDIAYLEGINPLERQDPKALPDLASELAAGDNPMQTDYRPQDPGYAGPDDPRMSFLKEENISYPLAYERIAALFDGEHAPDLLVEFQPWGWYPLGKHNELDNPGAHGPLNIIASRGPLIFAGKGVHKNKIIDTWARSVDIAPTIAKAMGFKKTYGVDETGHYSHDVYLKWQDGHVLDEVLDGETPTYLLILVNDALTHTEFEYQLSTDAELSTYRWMVENGTRYENGVIVNFPSNTFASHNTIGSGAYSGHHAMVDNWYYDRKKKKEENPISDVFDTAELMSDDVETLHEAIHRNFKNWDPDTNPAGNFTVSISDPSTKDADLAIMEGVQPVDFSLCPEPDLDLPPTDNALSKSIQTVDNTAVNTFVKAYTGTRIYNGKEVRCTQPPRYTIINLTLTDEVSHTNGPHSDGLRRVIEQTDLRQKILFDTLKQAGVFDDTLIVFTSDHGQALQDINRHQDYKEVLKNAGIQIAEIKSPAFIYLMVFDVELSTTEFFQGRSSQLEILVKDDDTGEPVANATIKIESGSSVQTAKTNSEGKASFAFTPKENTTTITVSDDIHTEYKQTY